MLKYFFKKSHPNVARGLIAPTLPKTHHSETLNLTTRADHIQQYHDAFHWPQALSEYLHPAYLAMHALQAQAPLILNPAQPFAAMGLVHMSNFMHYTRLPKCDETLAIRYEFGELWEQKRGWVFTVITQATDQSKNVIFNLESHYLSRAKHRCHSDDIPAYAPTKIAIPEIDSVAYKQIMCALPADLGRKYATLSGDYNPIHLHPWLSRWFGFKQPIIHGMWSKARALSEIAQTWSQEIPRLPINCSVQFTDFIPLPNRITLHQMQDTQRTVLLGLPEGGVVTQTHRPYFAVEVDLANAQGDNIVGDDEASVSG